MSRKPSTFKCKCGAPLGASDGLSLQYYVRDEITGEMIKVEFDRKPVTPRCGKCRRTRQWTPDKKARDVSA